MTAPVMVVPAVDIMEGQVVRLYRGDPNKKTIYGSDPVAFALKWQQQGADRLHIVDLDATLGRGSNYDVIRRVSDAVSIPVQVAGGLRTVQAALDAARTSDYIVVGTVAFSDEDALRQILDGAGRDRVIVSADHRGGAIVVRGWQDATSTSLEDAVLRMWRDLGVSNFLITDVSRDGTMEGPDTEHLARACKISSQINVTASGGISGTRDIPAVAAAGASGVILGRALYDGAITIGGAKEAARSAGRTGGNTEEEEDPQRR